MNEGLGSAPKPKCHTTYSLHCSSFLGLPLRILNIDLAKPKKGTTMETTGQNEVEGFGGVWGSSV